jgi:predicted phosphatase
MEARMRVIKRRPVFFDVDNTIILWDMSKYPDLNTVDVVHINGTATVAVHQKNLNMLVRLWKCGRFIVVHSGNGHAWAASVIRALGIEDCVDLVLDKPGDLYVDDMPAGHWLGERVWRDPVTGSSEMKEDE